MTHSFYLSGVVYIRVVPDTNFEAKYPVFKKPYPDIWPDRYLLSLFGVVHIRVVPDVNFEAGYRIPGYPVFKKPNPDMQFLKRPDKKA